MAATVPHLGMHRRALVLLALLLALITGRLHAQVAINSSAAAPAVNAMLDISSTTKGLLIPRMTRAQRNAIPTPAAGLLIYQTDSVTIEPMGFYYYDPVTPIAGWKHIVWNERIWQLGGNAGTTNTMFIGTTNNAPLIFRVANYDRGRISETGSWQLYSQYPAWPAPPAASPVTDLVHVQGGVKLNGGSNGNNEGTIRYVPATGGSDRGRFEGYIWNSMSVPGLVSTVRGWKQIDNNFQERKIQQTQQVTASCQDPTNTATTPAAVVATPRPWPIPGPTSGFGVLGGRDSPYYGLWEDSRRQYLFLAADLSAAGICPGPSNPIRAIAFNASGVTGSTYRLHFLRFRMKNTVLTTAAVYDNVALVEYSNPNPPEIAGPPPSYNASHATGYTVQTGWNVHPADVGVNFYWSGNNLLIDASVDNQDWPAREASVQSYNTTYTSMLSMYCDACGGTGFSTCLWDNTPPATFYYPPTTPTNGMPGTNALAMGWGYVGGWSLTEATSTLACDGDPANWGGSGGTALRNSLPRVAFLAKYTGGGAAYDVGNYMFAEEGVMVGDATWAASGSFPNYSFHGPGTITAQHSAWSNISLLNDYVFDLYYDGKIRPEDSRAATNYMYTPLKDYPAFVANQRRMPNVDGRHAWNSQGSFSLDQITNQLWVAVEDQALYIQELNARMDALQQFLVEKRLKGLERK